MHVTKKPLTHLVFYVVAFSLLITTHMVAPTSLAGPGLDAWVLLLMIIGIIILLFMGLRLSGTNRQRFIIGIIHVGGVVLLLLLLQF